MEEFLDGYLEFWMRDLDRDKKEFLNGYLKF